MKALVRIASTALFAACAGLPVHAEETAGKSHDITASISGASSEDTKQVSDADQSFDQAVAARVHAKLGETPDEDNRETLVHAALRAFYAGSAAAPLWVSKDGPTQKARDAAAEIGRGGAYGLDPQDYEIPDLENTGTAREALAAFELEMTRAVLGYAHHAKAGRIEPASVGHRLNNPESLKNPREFLESLRSDDDVAAQLRNLHPKNREFLALKKKLAELRGTGGGKPRMEFPDGPVLREGVTHEQVVLLRKRLDVEAGGKADTFDDTVKAAVVKFQKEKGLASDGVVGAGTRRALNGESSGQQIVRVLINMERWRWLPDDMGGKAGIYVWANIPEFRTRVVRGSEVVFDERVIVGKTDKQTPVFSDAMEWIEFHPTWYIPNSIKVDDIQPSLRRQTSRVMERYHLRLNCGSHGTDWRKIDWNKVDIRNCSVTQPPGERSVLGDFKFKFPNSHDVYMHDTPQKGLFNSTTRTYSHGCVRIQNPRAMAEVLLAHDKNMPSSRIGEILKGPKRLHKEDLSRPVPVHLTYFTAFVDADGAFQTRPDYYGHDRRLAQALTGKGHLMPAAPVAVSRRKTRPPRTRTARDTVWRNAFISAN